jgi:hypothetical protein
MTDDLELLLKELRDLRTTLVGSHHMKLLDSCVAAVEELVVARNALRLRRDEADRMRDYFLAMQERIKGLSKLAEKGSR